MAQAIIFDFYGVLALNGWQAFKAKHFTDREDIWDQIFEIGKQVDAGLSDYDELIAFTAEQSGESKETVRYQLEHTVANEDLLDYIRDELKPQYKIGILSNAGRSDALDEVLSKDQQSLFDSVTFSHHVGKVKPDPDMYNAAANRLDVDSPDCVFIDDQERHTNGARDAGMQAIIYTDLPALKAELSKIL